MLVRAGVQQQALTTMGLRAAASMSGSSAVEAERVTVCRYAGESEMGVIMALIDDELSEPYTVYTYRYFLNQWPHLCFLAHSGSPRRAVGVVICKLDRHFKGKRFMRGYIGMLSVQPDHRGRGIATRLLKVALAELVSLGAQEVSRDGRPQPQRLTPVLLSSSMPRSCSKQRRTMCRR